MKIYHVNFYNSQTVKPVIAGKYEINNGHLEFWQLQPVADSCNAEWTKIFTAAAGAWKSVELIKEEK